MKKLFTLFSLLPLAGSALAQAITINASDMPVPTAPYRLWDFTAIAAAPNPTVGTAANWDYSTYNDFTIMDTLFTESDSYFTGAGIDVYRKGIKSFNSVFGYDINGEYDFNTSDIKESGTNIPYQGFDISFSTGGTGDSLVIPAQKALLTTPKTIVKFPFTANSSWHSVSRRVTNFTLTVSMYALDHTPAQHAYYIHRDDSIVGWGKMRVYTPAGTSMAYDVLMDKIAQYAVDSFYLSGMPAPAAMLSAFMVAQGQKTDSNYRYNFYRKGSYSYLMSYYYGNDATYTNATGRYSDSAVTTANAGTPGVANSGFSTVLYPNPCTGSQINLMVMGNAKLETYTITDVAGRVVANGKAELRGGILTVDNRLENGVYVFTAGSADNGALIKETFTVAR